MRRKIKLLLLTPVLLLIVLLVFHQRDVIFNLHDYLQNSIDPNIFLLLMLVLPIFGAPLSIFLLLVGIQFGILEGLLITALLMGMHMICTYYIVHSFLRTWVIKVLKKSKLSRYTSKRTLNKWHLVIFMLIPGLPYTVKNNLLALSGIGFRPYLLICWATQFSMSIPLVLAGAAAIEMNPLTISLVLSLLILAVILQQYARKKFGESQDKY